MTWMAVALGLSWLTAHSSKDECRLRLRQ